MNTAYGLSAMLVKGIFPLFVQISCGYLLEWIPDIEGYVITYYSYARLSFFATVFPEDEKRQDDIKKIPAFCLLLENRWILHH